MIKNVVEDAYEDEKKLEDKVMKLLEVDLQMPVEDRKKVIIERAHRVGKKSAQHNRNIIVKLNGRGKGAVMRHVKNLKGHSTVKISDQFPPGTLEEGEAVVGV